MNNIVCFWLSAALIFSMLELLSMALIFFLPCAFGALITACAAVWVQPFISTLSIFIIAVLVAFMISYHFFVPYLYSCSVRYHSNVDALQGKRAIVIKSIEKNSKGLVKIDGQEWSAQGIDDHAGIAKGQEVEVVLVKGAHVKVRKIDNQGR